MKATITAFFLEDLNLCSFFSKMYDIKVLFFLFYLDNKVLWSSEPTTL